MCQRKGQWLKIRPIVRGAKPKIIPQDRVPFALGHATKYPKQGRFMKHAGELHYRSVHGSYKPRQRVVPY